MVRSLWAFVNEPLPRPMQWDDQRYTSYYTDGVSRSTNETSQIKDLLEAAWHNVL